MSSSKKIAQKILKLIESRSYKVVSFDVFDTLLHRSCPPAAVLEAVDYHIVERAKKLGVELTTQFVKDRRTCAYLECANRNAEAGLDQETHSHDFFPVWMRHIGIPESDIESFVEEFLGFEFQLEKSVISPDPTMVELLKTLKGYKVKIIFCSDMYLPKSFIEHLLEVNGLAEYFDEGYVSSEVKYLKRTGNLFKTVIENEMVRPNQILHIGDNVLSDYIQAKRSGIKAIWLKDKTQIIRRHMMDFDFFEKEDPNSKALLLNETGAFFAGMTTDHYVLGRQVFGPIYTTFIAKVIDRAKQYDIDKVFFLSREGHVLKQIYDNLTISDHSAPKSCYMAASRLVSFLFSIDKGYGLRHFSDVFSNTSVFTVENIFAPLAIPKTILVEACNKHGLSVDEVLPVGFLEWHPFIRVCEEQTLLRYIEDKVSNHSALYSQYLKQIGFEKNSRVMVVDVGWGGQIQDNLYRGLELNDCKPGLLIGEYLALNAKAFYRRQDDNWMESALSDAPTLAWNSYSAFDTVFIYEAVVRAPHGTVIGVEADNQGYIRPVCKDIQSGSRLVELKDDPILALIQRGIIDFSKKLEVSNSLYPMFSFSDLDLLARSRMGQLGRFPSFNGLDELAAVGNVADLGSEGVNLVGGGVGKVSIFKLRNAIKHTAWKDFLAYKKLGTLGVILLGIVKYNARLPKQIDFINFYSKFNSQKLGLNKPVTKNRKIAKKISDCNNDLLDLANEQHNKNYIKGTRKQALVFYFGGYEDVLFYLRNWVAFKFLNLSLKLKNKAVFYNDGLALRYILKRRLYAIKQYLKAGIKSFKAFL